MRLIQTEEQKSLWNAFKPYLVTNGLNVTLREDAPQEAKDAEALYSKLREKQKMQYLKDSGTSDLLRKKGGFVICNSQKQHKITN
jgi:hypothetical protein